MSFGGGLLLAPLSSLLGIRPGMNVCVHQPPEGFMVALEPLPEGVAFIDASPLGLDIQVLFSSTKPALIDHLARATQKMSVTGWVWVCFPSNGDAYSPSEEFVRFAALELGLHDTKRLMLDPAWNTLKLQRKGGSPRPEIPEVRA